jgi:threonine/homoserine/homoserine lactone efflux protein
MLTAAGAQAGLVRGLPCLLGVAAGMGVMMFVVPLGLGSLVSEHRVILRALHAAGAIFLLWLAWRIATAGGGVDAAPGGRAVGFWEAAIFQWINPKSWLVAVSAAGAFLRADGASPLAQATAFAGLFVIAAVPSGFVWLAFGAVVQHFLHERRRMRVFNVAMGILLALSVLAIVR